MLTETEQIGVYAISNPQRTKFYVGSSTTVNKRLASHLRALKKGTLHSWKLQKDWSENTGGDFVFEILEVAESEKHLYSRECKWIKNLKSLTDGYSIVRPSRRGLSFKFKWEK